MDDRDHLIAGRNTRGRGTGALPKSRFDNAQRFLEEEPATQIATEVLADKSKSILSTNDSPDLRMQLTLNPYRGCEHGCIYCYARPTHEYLGHSAGLDFETKLYAKFDAPQLLDAEFQRKSWKPRAITFSGITDCYQPIERKLQITRQCLQICANYRNPTLIITKNHLVTRDIDILQELARYSAIRVVLSITTLERDLSRRMEPRASQPEQRLLAIKELRAAGIPTSVNVAPIIPGLTDHEVPEILQRAADAGAETAHYVMVRLPYGVKELFPEWLETHYPDRKERILNRIKETRGGKLYDSDFGTRMRGTGIFAEQINQLFNSMKRKYGLDHPVHSLSTEHFKRQEVQLNLF